IAKTSKARAEILTDRNINNFMRPPSPVTLNKGLKTMGSQQPKVVTTTLDDVEINSKEGVTAAAGAECVTMEVNNQQEDENRNPEAENNLDVIDNNLNDTENNPDEPSSCSFPFEDDWMSMPPPEQPPKRQRGRARKAVLIEAIKESQAAKPFVSHRRMDDYKCLFTG
ncbi:unnamed protein product, partial [Meganyctiphanes norvegica]